MSKLFYRRRSLTVPECLFLTHRALVEILGVLLQILFQRQEVHAQFLGDFAARFS
jgi:hypothetical protein